MLFIIYNIRDKIIKTIQTTLAIIYNVYIIRKDRRGKKNVPRMLISTKLNTGNHFI